METTVSPRLSIHGRDDDEASKEAKRVLDHRGDRLQASPKEETITEVENGSPQREKEDWRVERSSPEPDSLVSSLNQNDHQDDRLESARAEMGEVKEENKRLKMYLDRIMKEYKTLQMQFRDAVKQDDHALTINHQPKEHDLVSLSLGPCSSFSPEKEDVKNKQLSSQARSVNTSGDQMAGKQDLQLSLDCKFEAASKSGTKRSPSLINISPENSLEDQEEENGEVWPPSKALKTRRIGDDEVSQQQNPPAKKARVSVRARCDTPTMNDGCQWRKYGQKIAKGNPCPRAYYRCTVAPSCPVKKQVQRCIDDMSILTTTYEGMHNHPLPVSATAMASTTAAAASMLLSGSSTSQSGQSVTPNAITDLHGLNLCLSDPSRIKQFYLPSNTTSMASAPTHPTITLDLTNPNPNSSSSHFNRFALSTYPPASSRYTSSSSLSFSSSQETTTALPISWGGGMLNYGNHQHYHRSQPQESFHHQPYLQKPNPQDSIAAATKAITTDPNFQSALAAAIKSIIGGNTAATGTGSTTGNNNFQGGGDGFAQRLRWNENNPINSSLFAPTPQVTGCASSFLNKSNPSSNSHQPGNLMFVHSSASSLQLANPKSGASTTTSPGDSRNVHPKLL